MSAGGTYLRCVAVGFASLTASIFWAPRPQMASYVLTALVLYVLYLRRHRGVDLLWALPLIMLVWANLHGGFVIGLLLIGGTFVGEALEHVLPLDERGRLDGRALRRLALVGLVSVVAVCVNPYGPLLFSVPYEIAGSPAAALIEEWAPPDLHAASFWPFAAMLVMLVLGVGASPRRLGWSDGLLSTGVTLLAISAGRNISTFAVVVTPVLTYHLHALLEERGWVVRPLKRATASIVALNALIIGVVAAVAVQGLFASFGDRLARSERAELPVGAVDYLRENGVRGRLFNTYDWGGYLIHALPQERVFVDGRSDLYGSDFLYSPYRVVAGGGPGWQQQLDRFGIGTVLLRRSDGLVSVLAASPAWKFTYADDHAVVFERRT
jgi:hypothetical protein